MKKKTKYLLIVLASVFVMFSAVWGSYKYVTDYKVTDVGTEQSESGQYIIKFQMIGEPEWSFGSTDVRVIVQKSDGDVIEIINASLNDDGKTFNEKNREVLWKSDRVEITLKGEEQDDYTITVML